MSDALKKANNYLRLAECRLVIAQRGEVLYLRGYLPDKATGAGLKQQRMSTGLSATPAGLKEAISLALRVNAELQAGQFDWGNYLSEKQAVILNPVEAFKAYYFSTRPDTLQTRTTWDDSYACVLNKLPAGRPSEEACRRLVLSYAPERRIRQLAHTVVCAFMRFHKVPYDRDLWATYRGTYASKGPAKRSIPSDAEIEVLWAGLNSDEARHVVGLLATFGLRTSELFHIDVTPLLEGQFFVCVDDSAKTKKERRAYALPQRWVDLFNLRQPWDHRADGTKRNKDLGNRISVMFKRLGLPPSYSLRHAYRLRGLKKGVDPVIISRSLGHSPAIGVQHYTRWLEEQDVADAFED